MRKSLWIITLVIIAATAAPNAHADSFSFTVTGGASGSGTFTTDPLFETTYLITAITGTFDGSAITSLLPPGTIDENDNLLILHEPFFDEDGVGFETAHRFDWNLFGFGGSQVVITPEFKFILVTATVTPVGLLLGAGLMGLLVIGRHKFIRSNGLA